MIVVLMGVTASGKTTVGKLLAGKTGWQFAEGDDYHSSANRDKMHRGIPLDDCDRAPWLARLHQLLLDWDRRGISGVLACSALKRQYRRQLAQGIPSGRLYFAFLSVSRSLLEERLKRRRGHYMNPSLLDSQLAALELPADAIHLDGELPPPAIVEQLLEQFPRGAKP